MHTKLLVLIVTVALVLLMAVPALAVTDGELDGSGHPYVGLMVAQDADGNPLWRCSGTLLSDTLFLTAGHCTEAPAAHVEIWFDADVDAGRPSNGYPYNGEVGGTPYTHPDFDPNAFFLYDLGVVVLDEAHPMSAYGTLPILDRPRRHEDTARQARRNLYRRGLWFAEELPRCGFLEDCGPAHPHGSSSALAPDQHRFYR